MQTVTSADSLYGRCRRGVSDCLAAQATQAETTGNIAGAEELYQESSRADSSNAVPEYDLGVLYASRGDQVNALRQFAAARLADPLSPAGIAAEQKALDGYLQLGDADRSQGNLSLARQDWQRVIDIDPGSPEAQQASARMSSGS
jgi:tetratricopeptide (TPR) repeat protein